MTQVLCLVFLPGQAGDSETAAILQRVHDEEVRNRIFLVQQYGSSMTFLVYFPYFKILCMSCIYRGIFYFMIIYDPVFSCTISSLKLQLGTLLIGYPGGFNDVAKILLGKA